jgi:cytochrome c oxidase subunit 2
LWFEPTIASEKVSEAELTQAITAQAGSPTWDFKKYPFTPDGYKYYDLYCAEYCGKDHSRMQTVVVVHESQADLDNWIAKYSSRPKNETLESYGQKLYNRRGCASCHSVDGSRRVGPSFQGFYDRPHEFTDGTSLKADENYIRESIVDPKAKVVNSYSPVMPSYKGQLSDDDINSIIAYLQSLSSSQPASEPEKPGDAPTAGATTTTNP